MKRSMYAGGLLFLAIGVAAVGAGVGAADDATPGAVLFGAVFLSAGALFFWVGSWGVLDTAPLPDTDLQRLGRPAVATVLEVEVPRIATDEVAGGTRVKLRVTPRNESAFKATARMAPSPAPRVGDEIRVKFDPNKRTHLIVMG